MSPMPGTTKDFLVLNLVCDLYGGIYELPVVSAIQCHSDHPEVAEEWRQDVLTDVVGLHALCGHALLHHLCETH
eukprot:2272639-Amphidinium_carterae.1